MSGEKPSRNLRLAAFVILFLLPLALRLLPIEHGGERIYVPDNSIVRSALGMARDHDLVPPVGRYSPYPNLVPYLLLPLYGIQYVAGRASGAWGSVKEFGEHLLLHPAHAAWIARALVAVFGALTSWVVYRLAREVGLRRGAWIAAWLAGTGLVSVHLSSQERPWVPVTFFLCASAWAGVVYVNRPRLRTLVLSGVLAGLAFACHQGGLAGLAIPACAWLVAPLGWHGRELALRLARGAACVVAFALAGVLLGHPYVLVHGLTRPDQAVGGDAIAAHGAVQLGGMSVVPEFSPHGFARMLIAGFGYDPVVLLLGCAGLVLAWRVRALRVPLLFTLVWSASLLVNYSPHVRYFLPITAFLALPAGLVAERMWNSRGARVVLVLLLAFPLIQAVRFDQILMRDDTRALAEAKLANLPAHALVAIDRYGPEVDLDRRAIYALAKLRNSRGQVLRLREEHRKLELDTLTAERAGVAAIHVEEFLGADPRTGRMEVFPGLEALGARPQEAFGSLGVTHFLRVVRHAGDLDDESLFGDAPPGRSVWILSPTGEPAPPRDAFLPMEMEFPLTSLWSAERPGPWIELRVLD